MKNRNIHLLKGASLSFCILAGIMFPALFNFLSISKPLDNRENSDDTFVTSVNGRDYLAKYITVEDIDSMNQNLETSQMRNEAGSSLIIDGHGTGYSIPTQEDLHSLIGKMTLLDAIPESDQRYQATADISSEMYFPAVGDQGGQGSCSAWANAYYAYGYLEAKDYGWDASSGNPDYLLSPAWAYNKVAAYDYGSIPYEIAQSMLDWGIPTLSAMPYDDSDVNSWGNETAWQQAPYHRPLSYTLVTYTGTATIDLIKSLLDGGTPFTIGIDAYQFSNGLNQGTMDFILSSGEYIPDQGLNHAQCLVGYDDAISEGSDVGAFRVVNSWGDSWMDGGYYWLTYDAFAGLADDSGQVLMYITDRIDYTPNLIATWEFSSSPTRMNDIVTLGVGAHDSPLNTIVPLYDSDTVNLFPDFMAVDISDFYSYYISDNDVFFYLEIGASDLTGTISSFKIQRYSGGVLQQISKESPDVPKITPGYVNATFKTFLHELRVALDVPTDPIIYNTYPIKATIYNDGASDESSVFFELLLNQITVSSTTIPSLPSDSNYTLNYDWTPSLYDIYNFTAQTPPLPGETYTSNNHVTEILPMLGPIFYDDFESGLSQWESITGMWHLTNASSIWPDPYHSPTHSMWFGDESTGNYDSGYQEMGELTSIPIDLSGTTYAELEFYHWREGEGGGYDVSYVYISTDGVNWNQIYTSSQQYISPWEKISIDISAYAGYPSVQVQFYFDTLDDLYNDYRGWLVDDVAILGNVIIPHDLRVSLEAPENPEVGNTYVINATVTNIGSSDETGVDFSLYLNGATISSVTIPSLVSGASYTLNYMWTAVYGKFNFTAYAPPISGELIINNNLVTKIFSFHKVNLFDGMFIDYTFTDTSVGSGPTEVSYSSLSSTMFHVTWQGNVAGIPVQGSWDVDTKTRLVQNPSGSNFGSNVHTPFWIFTDTMLGDIVPLAIDGEGDHMFNVTGDFFYELAGVGLVDVWILEDLALPGAFAWYEKSTGLLLYGDFIYGGGMGEYLFDYVDTNAVIETIVFDHDLNVYLETPLTNKVGGTYMINATVKNWGINDEHNVDLLLYLEGLMVASIIIPTLSVGMEQTIQYAWTPTGFGDYNFTAYAPPVPLESYLENNVQTQIVPLFDTELFNGLYMEYNFSQGVYVYDANFTYSLLGGSIYQESLSLEYLGTYIYNWQVDAKTRIMSSGSIFADGAHTPAWIFTNASLFDLIPIAVDGEGDHIFNVTEEFIYNLPGFGPVAVWQLEDLTQPGGIAWYEQSTGILLNATFYYAGGGSYYEFNFIDTNAPLTIVAPPDPFILSSTADVPDYDGKFDLTWTESLRADNYTVYQYSQYINVINGSLTILADEVQELNLDLSGYGNGTYYFIVVSHNVFGDTLSNCIQVDVEILPFPPDPFILSSNAGNPDGDGNFDLLWTVAYRADNYSVYLYSSYITAINGSLTQLAGEITDLNLALADYMDGTYYFIVVAHNKFGDTLSTCLEISVEHPPPGEFTLTSNAGNPDGDGNFDLTWTVSSDAASYSVYRCSSYITDINGTLTLLEGGMTELGKAINGYDNGVYYFIVVAHNNYGDTLSNCIKVTVQIAGPTPIVPGYNMLLFIVSLGVISSLFLKKKLKSIS
jgi:C1A family cysteine protease